MVVALYCIAAVDFADLALGLRSTSYDFQMRWDGGMTEEVEEAPEGLAVAQ